MTSGSAARRYARALYALAGEEGKVAETGSSLGELATAVAEVGAVLAPGLLDGEAREKLGRRMAAAVGQDSTLGKFIRLLALRDRLAELPTIDRFYVALRDSDEGCVRMKVTTATELKEADVRRLVEGFSDKTEGKILTETVVDESILGGAVVELEGRVYDGSVKTYLARLAQRMAGDAKRSINATDQSV